MPTMDEIRANLQRVIGAGTQAAQELQANTAPTNDDIKKALMASLQVTAAVGIAVLDATQPAISPQVVAADQERRSQINKVWVESNLNGSNERSKMVIELALQALRSVFLVNGGAILALLTFLGTARSPVSVEALRTAFTNFGVGLFLSLLAMGLSYVSQHLFSNSEFDHAHATYESVYNNTPHKVTGNAYEIGAMMQVAAFVVAVFSVGFFVLGAFAGLDALFPRT